MSQTLLVRILSPKQRIFEGEAISVSSKNSSGKFDILAEHANFITLIEHQPIVLRLKGEKPLIFNFESAIIYVSSSNVNIYTDIELKT